MSNNWLSIHIVVIDYFTRFVFVRPAMQATSETMNAILEDHIAPAFGWPKVVYTDNEGHFVGQKDRTLSTRAHEAVACRGPPGIHQTRKNGVSREHEGVVCTGCVWWTSGGGIGSGQRAFDLTDVVRRRLGDG